MNLPQKPILGALHVHKLLISLPNVTNCVTNLVNTPASLSRPWPVDANQRVREIRASTNDRMDLCSQPEEIRVVGANDDSRVNRCLALVQPEKVETILSEKNPILGAGEVEDFTIGYRPICVAGFERSQHVCPSRRSSSTACRGKFSFE